VQICTVQDITKATPANFKPVTIAPANGNGNGHLNANAATKPESAEKAAEAVAGD
jgi:hypothetical protein